tara:strand:- start:2270 stop:4384 length:2115 start_codon:yes stop_codon:yes gene_type:complete
MRLLLIFSIVLTAVQSCQNNSNTAEKMHDQTEHKHTNALINETSPYLLQHAHNPVNWHPWGDDALNKAKAEDKLILVSIGYSACHWCHVMERESFEDSIVAKIMNDNFVCIKVDREERPDIDQIYMNAVQLITKQGGWPLNCFALPDGRPVYGGTYFQKSQWVNVLQSLAKDYDKDKEKFYEYAENLTEGIKNSDLLPLNNLPAQFSNDTLVGMVSKWKTSFDSKEGGPSRAPKFPIPNNYQFLLRYGVLNNDQEVLNHVKLTLDKMAYGGIYDQIGGGFARYSTDILWKAPHFEKMLYDNAQLMNLYAEAYQYYGDDLYKDIVYQTFDFLQREMTTKNGAFYSALDADSEGEEGKFYVWKEEELKSALSESEYNLTEVYYNIGKKALWEYSNNILLRDKTDEQVAKKLDVPVDQVQHAIKAINKKLLKVRTERIRPALDDKTLTSWNALMISGLTKAGQVFSEKKFLNAAIKNANFIVSEQTTKEGNLLHSYKNGISKLDGFLEDYCFVIEAYTDLYQATFEQIWLERAKDLLDISIENFYDTERGMFYFTSKNASGLIARKMELKDNVIPASNSSMAKSLNVLGHYFDKKAYLNMSETMLNNIQPYMSNYGSGYSNWGQLYLNQVFPYYEIAIVGDNAKEKLSELNRTYVANKLLIGSQKSSELPLLENKYVLGDTYIYVCVNKSCQLPVTEVSEAVKQLKE